MTERETDLELHAKLRLGTVLRGKYRLDRVLGVGGMAVVYKATHRNQAEFAVKMLHAELSIREDVRTRFLREGYAANSVKHPGAVLVVDDDVAEDGAAFLVMELLDGEGVEVLWERMRSRVPVPAATSIVHQLLDVLSAAHAKGIVHRDIKPANLFATRDGTLKVLDFGIARARDAAASAGNATGTGVLLGTPAFMAPEQAMGQTSLIDGQTDVWAAGATLFALLAGRYVHEGENAAQLVIAAATRPARKLATVAPDVPAAIADVVDAAIAFDKGARWPSAAAMRDALDAACRATLGHPPGKSVLAAALGATAGASYAPAVSQAGSSVGVFAPTLASTHPPRLAAPPLSRPVTPPSPSPPMIPMSGGTTAQPISNEAISVPGVRRSNQWIASFVAVAAVIGIAGVYSVRSQHATGAASVTDTASVPALAPSGLALSTAMPSPPAPPALAPSASASAPPPVITTPPSKHPPGGRPPSKPSSQPPPLPSPVTSAAVPDVPPPQPPPTPKPAAPAPQNPLDLPIK